MLWTVHLVPSASYAYLSAWPGFVALALYDIRDPQVSKLREALQIKAVPTQATTADLTPYKIYIWRRERWCSLAHACEVRYGEPSDLRAMQLPVGYYELAPVRCPMDGFRVGFRRKGEGVLAEMYVKLHPQIINALKLRRNAPNRYEVVVREADVEAEGGNKVQVRVRKDDGSWGSPYTADVLQKVWDARNAGTRHENASNAT